MAHAVAAAVAEALWPQTWATAVATADALALAAASMAEEDAEATEVTWPVCVGGREGGSDSASRWGKQEQRMTPLHL